MKPLIVGFVLACSLSAAAYGQNTILLHQDTSLYLFGAVTDIQTGDSLPGTGIIITKIPSGRQLRELHADEHGKYDLYLGKGLRYRISYVRSDRVPKHVEIDAASVPDSSWHGGMAMEVNIALIKPFPGSNGELFDEAIGRSRYNPASNLLEWDLEYTQDIKARMDAVLEQRKR